MNLLLLILLGIGLLVEGESHRCAAYPAATVVQQVAWRDCLNQKPEWYASPDALRIADNLLGYQREVGGWPKNQEMAAVLKPEDRAKLEKEKSQQDTTIDNGATHTQLTYLARVNAAQSNERFRAAFLRGLDYLLSAQYENGGWPQFYPNPKGYARYITYNDDAIAGVLALLRSIQREEGPYRFVDAVRREKCAAAVRKGIDCILKTQIVVDGKKTAWCAQHDEKTFQPAPARTYEKISLSGSESVGIVRFLMRIENPTPQIIEAIEGVVAWLRAAQLMGIRVERKSDASFPNGFDRIVVPDPNAPPIWARFYEIGTNKPIFCGRDGIVKERLADIEHERRTGYAWYTDRPARLLNGEYPAWKRIRQQAIGRIRRGSRG